MATLVVPGICRYTVNQRMAGHVIANILDMQVDTTGTAESRGQACFDVAGDIINNWDDHIRPAQTSALTLESVSWVDLDSLDGATGSRATTSDTEWPVEGGGSEPAFPGSVSVLITKQCNGGRRTRNGRMYLAGYYEGSTPEGSPNTINEADAAVLQTAFNAFLDGINDNSLPSDTQRQLVVVHESTSPPSWDDVESLRVNRVLATQRRRLRD